MMRQGGRPQVYRTAMPAPPTLGPEEKRAALAGVLQTASFLRAEQLRNFLRFICEMEMSGRASEITEYLIGVEALGRPPGYSTAEDSIVRRRAIDLREKLDEVYATELSGARVRIELPKGRYVPHFVRTPAPANGRPGEEKPVPPASSLRPFLLGVFVGGAVTAAVVSMVRRPAAARVPAPEVGITYEAESAANVLHGATTVGTCGACSGGARVRNIGNSPG